MADLQRSVEIIFGGVDNTGDALSSIGRNLEGLEANIGSITGPIAGATEAILKFEAGVAAVGVAILGGALAATFDYAEAQALLNKGLSEGEGTAADYGAEILAISQDLNTSQTEVLATVTAFHESGRSMGESLDLARAALTGVQIGEVDLESSTQILNSTLRGFNLSAEDSSRVLDALNGISATNGVTFRELATGLGDIAPVAQSTGFTLEQMGGLLVPVIERFGSGSEASRGLRTALLNLADPTGTVVDALSAVGVSILDTEGYSRGAKVVLEDLVAVWPTLSDNVKTATASQIAGKDQAAKFLAVLENWPTVLKATADGITPVITATEELAVKLEAPPAKIDAFMVALENAAIAIGQQFLPETVGVIDAATGIENAFAGVVASGGLEPLFNLLRPLLSEFEGTLRDIAKNLPEAFEGLDYGRLIDGFRELGAAVSGLFEGIDLSTPEGLTRALQSIVDVGASLLQWTADVIRGLEPFFDLVAAGVSTLANADDGMLSFVGQLSGLATGVDLVLPLVGGLSDILTGLGGAISAVAGAKTLGLLSTNLFNSATAATALTTALGAAGLAAAVAYASTQVYSAIDAAVQLNEQLGRQDDAAAKAEATERKLAEAYGALSDRTGVVVTNTQEFNKAVEDGLLVYDMAQGAWVAASQAVGQLASDTMEGADSWTLYGDGADRALPPVRDMASAMSDTADSVSATSSAIADGAGALGELAEKLIESRQEGDYLVKTFETADGGIRIVRERVQGLSTDAEKLAKDEAEAAKHTEALRIKMLELATDERIATINAAVEINAAQTEADIRRVEAAFDSLNTGIKSTGDTLSSLVGDLAGLQPNTRGYNDIMEIVKQEVKLREQEFELQKKLVEEQLKLMEARRQSLARGDALVTINADGLNAHMEAFLYELLQQIQIRATEEGQQWLGLLNCAGV